MKQMTQSQLAKTVLAMGLLAFFTACGKSGGNNSQPPVVQTVVPFQQCANCQNINGPVIFTAESIDYTGSLKLNWSFIGQATAVAQNPAYPTQSGYTPGTYNGAIAASGILNLSQNMNIGYCVIPAGVYNLATVQAGQWYYGGAVSNLGMQAVNGSYSLILALNNAFVSSPGYLQDNQMSSATNPTGRMFGELQIVSVNGQACQQIVQIQ